MIFLEKIELMAPAGDIEKLKIALLYGADIVYIGGKKYSLRANASNFTIEDIWGEKNEEIMRRERRETFLGMKNSSDEIENTIMEDEIVHAKRNYFPEHVFHISFNYEEDEELDMETYNFFVKFVEKHKNEKITAKIKLVLSYINDYNHETGKPLFTNKMKNEKLHYWKQEYDKALQENQKVSTITLIEPEQENEKSES